MSTKRTPAAVLVPIFLCALAGAAWAADDDGDGLSNEFEDAYGTDKYDADSDDDGVSDSDEITIHGTNPNDDDSDGDGTNDGDEIANETDPLDPGTALDGTNAVTFATAPTSMGQARSGQTPFDGAGVNVTNGQLIYSLNVGSAKGVKLPFSYPLYYCSGWNWDGRNGMNVTSTAESRLSVDGSGNVTIWSMGRIDTWNPDGLGGFDPASTSTLDVLTIDSGDYTVTSPGGYQMLYSGGRLVHEEDRFGNSIDYSRDGAGKVTAIADSRGESHSLSYYTTGRLQTLTMADGRAWTFRYNPMGQLMRIEGPPTTQFPSGIWTEFRYSNGSSTAALNNNMIAAIDGRGQKWMRAWYDTSDRVTVVCNESPSASRS